MGSKILVTGASGFIGSAIVRQLIEAGEHVKAFVRASSSRKAFVGLPADQLEIVEGDVTVGHTVFRALAGCDRLFHVAAMTKFWDKNPSAIEDTAIIGTGETLEAARRRKIEQVVYTSSVATLGTTSTAEEMDESHDFNIEDPDTYIRAKKRAEEIALDFQKDFHIATVLPGSVYGPGDRKPTTGGQNLLRYLGWNIPFVDFPVPDGGLSVVDVDDVARGHLLALQKGKNGHRYILGGDNLTFEQMFSLMAEVTGLPGPASPMKRGTAQMFARLMELRSDITGDPPEFTYKMARDFVGSYVWVSSGKAERELGYTHRSARRALARSVQFYLANGFVPSDVAQRIRVDLRAA